MRAGHNHCRVLGAAGCENQTKPPLYGLKFGLTKNLRTGGAAPDFIPSFRAVIPAAIRECRAEFLGFEKLTDSAAGAYFAVKGEVALATTCIQRRLPQGHIINIERTVEVESQLRSLAKS